MAQVTPAPPTGEREGARVHDLKIWPEFFAEMLSGRKTFEARWNDRDFRVGDVLLLREWKPPDIGYTGRELRRTVTYALFGSAFGVAPGFVILALAPAPAQPGEGEPSVDEVWSALEAVVNSFTLPEEEAAHAAARALLERRGGKGLSGKGGG